MIIKQCFDSHLHLLATGLVQSQLNLKNIKSFAELKNTVIPESAYRGGWLFGFGWDQHKMTQQTVFDKSALDPLFPDIPVYLSRADGHVCLVNLKALQILNIKNSDGIFIDNDKVTIDKQLPEIQTQDKIQFLKSAIKYLNQQGFTHVRDMTCDQQQWILLRDLDAQQLLTLYVVCNFTCDNLADFDRCVSEINFAKAHPSKHLMVGGVKIFLDGALGSQGALISQTYDDQSSGLLLISPADLQQIISKTWKLGLDVCIHTIGDQAIHLAAETAYRIASSGQTGRIHFEHGQIIRPQTVEILKNLDCVVHMQPCHYLSDKTWLKQKLGRLYENCFPWAALSKANIKINFGSDVPIEEASVINNIKAIQESALAGILPIEISESIFSFKHQSLFDGEWGSHCQTEFRDHQVHSVIFDGKKLL
jgi:predicted amidohydrolase YtcJ